MPDDLFPRAYTSVPDAELTAAIAAAIRIGASPLSRTADAFLATIAAEVIADRLVLAGFVVIRLAGNGEP